MSDKDVKIGESNTNPPSTIIQSFDTVIIDNMFISLEEDFNNNKTITFDSINSLINNTYDISILEKTEENIRYLYHKYYNNTNIITLLFDTMIKVSIKKVK